MATEELNNFVLKIATNEIELPTGNLDEATFLYKNWKIF